METLAVIDFETTGLGATQGGRATEIAAVLVQGGEIVGRFQSLMNSGARVPPFITQLTGITNAMLQAAPPARAVMHEVARFTKGCPLVAHNAAFDRGFWRAELAHAECETDAAQAFACTMLLSRRLYPHAENHKLGTLARLHALPSAGRAHRALADAEVTAHLLVRMQRDATARFETALAGSRVDHALLLALQRAPREGLARALERAMGSVTRCSDTIAADHGHVLAVAVADLASLVDLTYDIHGTATHTHSVTLSAADLSTLKGGMNVSTLSTVILAHQHAISVLCT